MASRDVVLNVTQPGYDARSAADYQLVASSKFPALKIVHTGRVEVPGSTAFTFRHNIFDHNFGYPPFYLVWTITGSGANEISANDYASEYGPRFWIDDNQLFSDQEELGYKARYMIFDLPLDQDFTSPVVLRKDVQRGYDRNYGLKVAREGRSINSKNLADFVAHTRSATPTVHMVKHSPALDEVDAYYDMTVQHGLDYNPVAYGFVKARNVGFADTPGPGWAPVPPVFQSVPAMVRGDGFIKISGLNNAFFADASIVILKDPFVLAENIEVRV